MALDEKEVRLALIDLAIAELEDAERLGLSTHSMIAELQVGRVTDGVLALIKFLADAYAEMGLQADLHQRYSATMPVFLKGLNRKSKTLLRLQRLLDELPPFPPEYNLSPSPSE